MNKKILLCIDLDRIFEKDVTHLKKHFKSTRTIIYSGVRLQYAGKFDDSPYYALQKSSLLVRVMKVLLEYMQVKTVHFHGPGWGNWFVGLQVLEKFRKKVESIIVSPDCFQIPSWWENSGTDGDPGLLQKLQEV